MTINKQSKLEIVEGIFTSKGEQNNLVLLNYETGIYFGLDDIGAVYWSLIEKYKYAEVVLEQLVNEFGIDQDVLWGDLVHLVKRLTEKGLIRVDEA
jgi:hypothetical protein